MKIGPNKKNTPTKCCIDAINTRIQRRRSSADQISDPEVAVWNAQNMLKWMAVGGEWGEQKKLYFFIWFLWSAGLNSKKIEFLPLPLLWHPPPGPKMKIGPNKKNIPTKCCIDAINTRIQRRRSSEDQISDPEVAVWNAQNMLKWMAVGGEC